MLSTDFHSHLIPQIDDGSRSDEQSVIMARALARLGGKRVHVTPHQFRFGNDLDPDDVRERTEALRRLFAASGIQIEVEAGAEYLYGERLLDALDHEEELLTWPVAGQDGTAVHVLIELPLSQPVVGVGHLAEDLCSRKVHPVMAHPERVAAVQASSARLARWRERGWLFQLDLLSLVGAYGPKAARAAHALHAEGVYDFTGGDLHRPSQLPSLRRAHEAFERLPRADSDAWRHKGDSEDAEMRTPNGPETPR